MSAKFTLVSFTVTTICEVSDDHYRSFLINTSPTILPSFTLFFLALSRVPVSKKPVGSEGKQNTSLTEVIVIPLVTMAISTPSMVVVHPLLQRRTLEMQTKHTVSSKEENSQLLNAFLESGTRTAPTHLASVNAAPFHAPNSTILTLPLNITKKILRNLLTSPSPLILQRDTINMPNGYRTYIDPNILLICKTFHNIGVPILYGENTLTAPSPSTSFDFDEHIQSLPGSKRQMITNIKLEIDWADQLWAKFPLLARALGELRSLQKLEIAIVEKGKTVQQKRAGLIADVPNLKTVFTHEIVHGKRSTAHHHCGSATDRTNVRMKREGHVADAMLKAEMKMLHDLVTGIKGLKDFRLTGFRHEVFAWCLEERVRIGG